MTMCGLLIPVSDGSSISVFEHILVDIGDSQSIEQNLSTFSSHTNKVIEILATADEKSLVLLDELGSGTDPVEGAALAVSIIKRLIFNGAKLMVTTHYQELKVFAIDTPDVQNASCEFDIETRSSALNFSSFSRSSRKIFSCSSASLRSFSADSLSCSSSSLDNSSFPITSSRRVFASLTRDFAS